jgi:integrase/recombinase XerD
MRGQNTQAKSPLGLTEVLRETTKLRRKHHLSYDQSRDVVAQVRRALQLSAPRERRRTVERLDKQEVGRLIEAAYRQGSRYGLRVKTLLYTGARVSEFINIRVVDLRLDLEPPQVYLAVAKGGSDGYVPILPALAQELRTHLSGRKAIYLFEQSSRPLYPASRTARRPGRGQTRGPRPARHASPAPGKRGHPTVGGRDVHRPGAEIPATQAPQHDPNLCRDQPEEPGRALPACALMTASRGRACEG